VIEGLLMYHKYTKLTMFHPLAVMHWNQRTHQAKCLHQNLKDLQIGQLIPIRSAHWSPTWLSSSRAGQRLKTRTTKGKGRWSKEHAADMKVLLLMNKTCTRKVSPPDHPMTIHSRQAKRDPGVCLIELTRLLCVCMTYQKLMLCVVM